MVQAQEWLDKKYPKEIRSNITEINISKNYNILENEYLVGNLKLEGFKNLKKFDCSRNSITNLDMNDKLLKNLEKLEYLEISDTDIDKGLEYLSDSVEEIGCSIFNRGQCGVKKIKDKLCLFVSFEDDGYFTCKFQPWKMLNKLEEKNKQLEKDFEEERSIRISLQDQINEYFQKNLQLQNDLRQIDMENQQLQKKLSNLQIQNINQQSDSIIHQFSAFENQIEEFDDSFQEEEEEEEEGSDCSFEVVSQEIIE
ncbi:hypothetical protein GLOIN_2v1764251 [Rhizophagus irregularis DAOM 181602=DAOM 197198]|nr:hypothetical protein GLOIN_2v1764251 [Rhizophagus irregularis DAOM 181602=DAOM 197198]